MTYNLLLGTAQKILVHFTPEITRIAVASHQVVDMCLQRKKSQILYVQHSYNTDGSVEFP